MTFTLRCQDRDDEHFDGLEDALEAGDALWDHMTVKERLACEILEVWEDGADEARGPEYNWPAEGPRGTWTVTPHPDGIVVESPDGETYEMECRTTDDVWDTIGAYTGHPRIWDWMTTDNTCVGPHDDAPLFSGRTWSFPDCEVEMEPCDRLLYVRIDGPDGVRVVTISPLSLYDDVMALDEGRSPVSDGWEDGAGRTVCYEIGVTADDDGMPMSWPGETLGEWVETCMMVHDTPEALVAQAGGDIAKAAREWVAWWFGGVAGDVGDEEEARLNRGRLHDAYDMTPDQMVGWMTRYLESNVETPSEVTADIKVTSTGNSLILKVTEQAGILGVRRGDVVNVTIRRKD